MGGGSSSKTYNTTNTENLNSPNTIGGSGSIIALHKPSITESEVRFTTADPEVAQAAIKAVQGVAASATESSHRIASEVADSQRRFLSTQTGQDTGKVIILTASAVAAGAFLANRMFGK